MKIDGTALEDEAELSADVVVVGAGPAGIVTALEVASEGFTVILIESGGEKFDPRIQRSAEASEWDPRRHAEVSMATRRQVGGASVIWGRRCVPYYPVDFDQPEFRAQRQLASLL